MDGGGVEDTAVWLITLGGLFALGLVTDLVGRRTPLPRVTLLILFGVAIGPTGVDWLPIPASAGFRSWLTWRSSWSAS
jgi:NhaP-type Na+/H+ or K+/H+ antiporter